MKQVIDEGGSAFPVPTEGPFPNGEYISGHPGMTRRQYLACHAPEDEIEGIAGSTIEDAAKLLGIETKEYKNEIHYPRLLAKARYIWADAMIEAGKEAQ